MNGNVGAMQRSFVLRPRQAMTYDRMLTPSFINLLLLFLLCLFSLLNLLFSSRKCLRRILYLN